MCTYKQDRLHIGQRNIATTPQFPRPADFRLAIEGLEGTSTAVPEPATMSLVAMGLLSGAAFRRRSRKPIPAYNDGIKRCN